jgi:hypothetical protein
MKITFRKVTEQAWINNTWLAPYTNRIVKLIETKRKMYLVIPHLGNYKYDVTDDRYEGWKGFRTIKMLLSRPLKNIKL